MPDEIKPVALPLPADVSRCLGHDGKLGQSCIKAETCARHLTIRHALEPWDAPETTQHYKLCSDERYHCYLEAQHHEPAPPGHSTNPDPQLLGDAL